MLIVALSLAQVVSGGAGKAAPVPAFRGPAAVVLLKDGCPCARECRLSLNALAAACRGRVRFVGLLDASPGRTTAFVKEAALAATRTVMSR